MSVTITSVQVKDVIQVQGQPERWDSDPDHLITISGTGFNYTGNQKVYITDSQYLSSCTIINEFDWIWCSGDNGIIAHPTSGATSGLSADTTYYFTVKATPPGTLSNRWETLFLG